MHDVVNEVDLLGAGIFAIKFSASWCAPCKRMEPTLKTLEEEFSTVKFISVDVDETPNIAQKYKVRALPTILTIKDGQEINRITGFSLIEPLRKIFRDVVENCKP